MLICVIVCVCVCGLVDGLFFCCCLFAPLFLFYILHFHSAGKREYRDAVPGERKIRIRLIMAIAVAIVGGLQRVESQHDVCNRRRSEFVFNCLLAGDGRRIAGDLGHGFDRRSVGLVAADRLDHLHFMGQRRGASRYGFIRRAD